MQLGNVLLTQSVPLSQSTIMRAGGFKDKEPLKPRLRQSQLPRVASVMSQLSRNGEFRIQLNQDNASQEPMELSLSLSCHSRSDADTRACG